MFTGAHYVTSPKSRWCARSKPRPTRTSQHPTPYVTAKSVPSLSAVKSCKKFYIHERPSSRPEDDSSYNDSIPNDSSPCAEEDLLSENKGSVYQQEVEQEMGPDEVNPKSDRGFPYNDTDQILAGADTAGPSRVSRSAEAVACMETCAIR